MTIPTSWRQIYLPQFEAALLVEQTVYDDEIDRQVEWIAALTNSTRDEIASLPFDQLTSIAKQLAWVKNPQFNTRIPKFFTAGGKLWEVVHEINKLSAAQYAELCTWMKDDPMNNLDKVMATITIQRKWWLFSGKYDGETHAERAAIFRKHLSLAVIYPISLFFSLVYTRLMLSVQTSSLNHLNRINREMAKELIETIKEQSLSKEAS